MPICPKCNRGGLGVPLIGFLNKRLANFARCPSCRAKYDWRALQKKAHELANNPQVEGKNLVLALDYTRLAVLSCSYPYHLRHENHMREAGLGVSELAWERGECDPVEQPWGFGGYLLIAFRAAQQGYFYTAKKTLERAIGVYGSLGELEGGREILDRQFYKCWLECCRQNLEGWRKSLACPMGYIVNLGLDVCPTLVRNYGPPLEELREFVMRRDLEQWIRESRQGPYPPFPLFTPPF